MPTIAITVGNAHPAWMMCKRSIQAIYRYKIRISAMITAITALGLLGAICFGAI